MKILIVKTSAIGDVIQTLPVLADLRARFPQAQIDWVVEAGAQSLLQSHPLLDHTLPIDTKKWRKEWYRWSSWRSLGASIKALRKSRYDLIFDLQGNLKSAAVTYLAKGAVKVGFDRQGVREKGNLLVTNCKIALPLDLPIQERYLQLIARYLGGPSSQRPSGVTLRLIESEKQRLKWILQQIDKRPCIMVCFGSKWKNKQLPESTWGPLLEKITEECHPFYLFMFGSAEEELVASRLQAQFSLHSLALGQLSLPLWQVLMGQVDLVVAVDSAALHLCATTSTPSFSIFGPTQSAIYKPQGPLHHCVQGRCPYGKSFVARCPILRTCPTGACIHDLSAEVLFQRFKEVFVNNPITNNFDKIKP